MIDEYIRHREERERQVLDALRTGLSTPEEITARIYADLPPGLLAAAADTVLAHLVQLEEAGSATRVGNRWAATP